MIDLPDDQIELVRSILRHFVPDRVVVAYGSRVKGRARKYSDLDLCVMGDTRLPSGLIYDMKEAFIESDLPIKVDVADWAATEPYFQEIIKGQAVRIF